MAPRSRSTGGRRDRTSESRRVRRRVRRTGLRVGVDGRLDRPVGRDGDLVFRFVAVEAMFRDRDRVGALSREVDGCGVPPGFEEFDAQCRVGRHLVRLREKRRLRVVVNLDPDPPAVRRSVPDQQVVWAVVLGIRHTLARADRDGLPLRFVHRELLTHGFFWSSSRSRSFSRISLGRFVRLAGGPWGSLVSPGRAPRGRHDEGERPDDE